MSNKQNAVCEQHLESLASAVAKQIIHTDNLLLPTVASTVDRGLWLDVSSETPVPKYFYGGEVYTLGGANGDKEYKIPDNLVAYLPFDEDVPYDILDNAWTSHGSPSISTEIKRFGKGSAHFGYNSYLLAENLFDVNADKWTFDCWVYYTSLVGENNGIFAAGTAKKVTVPCRYGVTVTETNCNIAAPSDDSWQFAPTMATPVLNQWLHFAAVKDGNAFYFFENGVLLSKTEALNLPMHVHEDNTFWLGGTTYGADTDVYLDSVRFFNTALWTENFTPPSIKDYFE